VPPASTDPLKGDSRPPHFRFSLLLVSVGPVNDLSSRFHRSNVCRGQAAPRVRGRSLHDGARRAHSHSVLKVGLTWMSICRSGTEPEFVNAWAV
jgi:hypothetical protein